MSTDNIFKFDYTPSNLVEFLNQKLIGQEEAKRGLASAVCLHYKRVERGSILKQALSEKNEAAKLGVEPGYVLDEKLQKIKPVQWDHKLNPLLIGPSGCGKTSMVHHLANFLDLPFVSADISKFTEAGYVGRDIEDIIADLYTFGGDQAEIGFVFLDEFCKIADMGDGRKVGRSAVQEHLLTMLESEDVAFKINKEELTMSTKKVMFILGGAFEGLDSIVKRRLGREEIGFTNVSSTEDYSFSLIEDDLINYGISRQLIGRIGVPQVLKTLSSDQLYLILKTLDNSILKQKEQDFLAYDMDLKFTSQALKEVASLAHATKTGARGLKRIMDSVCLPLYSEFAGSNVDYIKVKKEDIHNPQDLIRRLRLYASCDKSKHGNQYFYDDSDFLEDVNKQNTKKGEPLESIFTKYSLPDSYLSSAQAFLKQNSTFVTEEIEDVISSIDSSINDFVDDFGTTHSVELYVSDSLKDLIICDTLNVGKTNPLSILNSKIGIPFSSLGISENYPSEIRLDVNSYLEIEKIFQDNLSGLPN